MKELTLDYALLEIGKGSIKIQVFTTNSMKSTIQPDRNRSWLVKDFNIVHDEDQTIKITGKKVELVVSRLLIGDYYYFSPSQYELMCDDSKNNVKKLGPIIYSENPVQLTSNESRFDRIYFNYPIEIVPTDESCLGDACSLAAIVGSRGFKNGESKEESEQSGIKS